MGEHFSTKVEVEFSEGCYVFKFHGGIDRNAVSVIRKKASVSKTKN